MSTLAAALRGLLGRDRRRDRDRGRTMTTYYKAVRPDYTDFWIGTVRYEVGTTLTHPNPHRDDASGYFSVSVEPAACAGMDWPCRLLVIEPVDPWTPDPSLPHKRAFHVGRVVREVDAHLALGPQGREVVALIERAARLTERERVAAARDAAQVAAQVDAAGGTPHGSPQGDAARVAGVAAGGRRTGRRRGTPHGSPQGDAARDAGVAAWDARDAASALVIRDLNRPRRPRRVRLARCADDVARLARGAAR